MVDPIVARIAVPAINRLGAVLYKRHRLAQGSVDDAAFTKIVDALARDAEELRRSEFRGMPDHEWTAAAECLKAAFEQVGQVDARIEDHV